MRILIFLSLLLLLSGPLQAQSDYTTFNLSSHGVLVLEDHKLAIIRGKMDLRARKLTRKETGESVSGIAVFLAVNGETLERFTGVDGTSLHYIDRDEIQATIDLLKQVETRIETEQPVPDTQIYYQTRDGLMIGAKYYGKWKTFVGFDGRQVFAPNAREVTRIRKLLEYSLTLI